MSADSAAGELLPRLCCLEKGPNGYGFHLHGEKGKVGQFIRLVEPGSPAEKSGLLAGDRLVEVNGENVEKETHQQVVSRIRAALNAVRLLVVDPETDEHLKKLGVPIREELLRAQKSEQAEPPAAADTPEAGDQNEAEKSHLERVSAGWAGCGTRIPRDSGAPNVQALSETRAARRKRLPPSDPEPSQFLRQALEYDPRLHRPVWGGWGVERLCRLHLPCLLELWGRGAKKPSPLLCSHSLDSAPQLGLIPGLSLPAAKLRALSHLLPPPIPLSTLLSSVPVDGSSKWLKD